jgi:hypothetical protein
MVYDSQQLDVAVSRLTYIVVRCIVHAEHKPLPMPNMLDRKGMNPVRCLLVTFAALLLLSVAACDLGSSTNPLGETLGDDERSVDYSDLPQYTSYSFFIVLEPGVSFKGVVASAVDVGLPAVDATFRDMESATVMYFDQRFDDPEEIARRLKALPTLSDAWPVGLSYLTSM